MRREARVERSIALNLLKCVGRSIDSGLQALRVALLDFAAQRAAGDQAHCRVTRRHWLALNRDGVDFDPFETGRAQVAVDQFGLGIAEWGARQKRRGIVGKERCNGVVGNLRREIAVEAVPDHCDVRPAVT